MRKKDKLIQGVGINDADYVVNKYENGKMVWRCPYYKVWKDMLSRAYNDKYKQKHQTYQDVVVSEEWYSFMNFRSWMETQDWEGKQLDKDILVQGNKEYSPNTCVFVSGTVNTFLLDCAASRGEWPLGVCWNKQSKKFMGLCRNPFTNKKEYLGLFTCPHQAHLAWKAKKTPISLPAC